MPGLAVYGQDRLSFVWDILTKSWYMFLTGFILQLESSFSSIDQSFSLCTVFAAISSDIDEVWSTNPCGVFIFWDFIVHHKDWLTFSSGTDRPGEVCYNLFAISQTTLLSFSIAKFWSCCLSFHLLSFKLKRECPFLLHSLWLFWC